jgi:pilus assembly protein Flp/PilA
MSRNFLKDDSGATAIEYGLIAALVSVGMLAGLTDLSDAVVATYNMIAGSFP